MQIRWSLVGVVLAAWLPLFITAAPASLWQWSTTPSTNASADPSINWREGQPPSSVNDSARAMMAALALYNADISGANITTGTSTAYLLTTNSAFVGETFASLVGQMVAFTVNVTNSATATLNVDSLGAKPLRSAPNVEIGAGVLVQGTPYRATYYTSNGGEWILHDFYGSASAVPIGALIPYSASAAPNSSFVLTYGQCISRTTYATYFGLVGTTYGACDGTTTFGVPDTRGRAVFGLDNQGGSAANRITVAGGNFDATVLGGAGGSQLSSALIAHTHSLNSNSTLGENATHTHTFPVFSSASVVAGAGVSVPTTSASGVNNTSTETDAHIHALTGNTSSAGSGSSYPILSPAIVMPMILRII